MTDEDAEQVAGTEQDETREAAETPGADEGTPRPDGGEEAEQAAKPSQQQVIESIGFDGVEARVYRSAGPDLYFQLEPPDAKPAIVANTDATSDQIVEFVNRNLPLVREMRADMTKHFAHTKSLECRYQTGDVAYVLGRPFMLRVFSSAAGRKLRHAARGRANTGTRVNGDVSLVEIFVIQMGDYDQRRLAFTSWASGVYRKNVEGIIAQAAGDAGISQQVPHRIQTRPMRSGHVRFDPARDTIWISDGLIPYPPVCTAYAFMAAAARELIPDLSETSDEHEEIEKRRHDLIAKGCPGWVRAKAIFDAENSPYARQ